MDFFSGEILAGLVSVLVVNLILSGDNAVVIAMAARQLEGANRRKAIFWGAGGAVVLRLIFAAIVTFLLQIPFLQVVGGLLLIWIAWQLVQDDHDDEGKVQAGQSTWEAVRIIIIADAVMSLDNVIALVQAARIDGDVDFILLGVGLITTIPLVIFGAALLTSLLDRFPILVYLGAGLLIYLAVEMFFADVFLHHYLKPYEGIEWIIGVTAAAIFMAVAWMAARRSDRRDRMPEDVRKSAGTSKD
ncbi:MAG TPA: TerC family protein [Rubrobacteraceae bacterium]|nr:TerC family protein [Rubrobacteraceae bacterium]